MTEMNVEEIIQYIGSAKKKTPTKAYIKGDLSKLTYPNTVKVFGDDRVATVFGDWTDLAAVLQQQGVTDYEIENNARNSAVPLLDLKNINARIEPGTVIRDQVTIGHNAVIMMGAVINIGCEIGENSMIDMGVVMGGRAIVGKHAHIGAGAVLAGVIEPASAQPVVIEDNVLIGANAVVIEGVRVGEGAVVAAGSIVTKDVMPHTVVAGNPARKVKDVDAQTESKTTLEDDLRKL
ncbi:2,3,4,5-tetrahydropyridine-2,6-dicarboxylate N-acetyltransferase [Fructobacillus fructosus]|uniref:2,3,4,5-tetrahydropyridine-2,6-dicarboxylate N-acetyltransferase n=1 Tax=Fructobacillus fructosus TaxID=1631 RepID=A0ABM9MRA4_9LACO|nr:2,3,4,5-tetrahydropyridine-2,6-dicarboxylate N-acetyltransferase [Fructobacillus fructosus]MBD9365472.1 2,3,4,5-tetrahydropyridine-2,6-dicarboxylate N-acetyltransferase [Leuconostoc mesenteroides]MBC9118808.1 2,3,4,5-tetrahydropyridine-2,6-dicarboxylate N-acetyltransferase [Fructobacillus fructosus]MCK8638396.1 2,3,4,5-tetrahydropyridine-2,6-dicarboxylate N-acetyltransferase [Fructobacillus fructosus]CAK1234481.1 Tetrahydrodipicolinate N-succinyltransferase (DapD) [Fructobacillus fructosus]